MATSWTENREHYEAIARKTDPAVILTTKDSKWWFVFWLALVLLTLGLICIKMGWSKFKHEYATTLGPVQGYPSEREELSERLIVHEGRHTTQAVFFGWFVPVLGWFFGRRVRAVVGLIPMGLVYGLLPVPILFAFGRYYLELDAEKAAWRWMLNNSYAPEQVLFRAQRFGPKVCGGEYLWAWVGGSERFTRAALKVIDQHRSG